MIIEALAVIVYGVLALVFAALLAIMQYSAVGMALAFAAAGAAYLFQTAQVGGVRASLLIGLQLASIALTVLSVLVALSGY